MFKHLYVYFWLKKLYLYLYIRNVFNFNYIEELMEFLDFVENAKILILHSLQLEELAWKIQNYFLSHFFHDILPYVGLKKFLNFKIRIS